MELRKRKAEDNKAVGSAAKKAKTGNKQAKKPTAAEVKERAPKQRHTIVKVKKLAPKKQPATTKVKRLAPKKQPATTKVKKLAPKKQPITAKTKQPAPIKRADKQLDLAFAMDCTGSMARYITSARDNIKNIVEKIVAVKKCDVRLALVEYRDHPPQDKTFVTKVHDFTKSPQTMKHWLANCSASGGGDAPEAVADALNDVLTLKWREDATKICVCISDAPPHGLGCAGDGFPDGCPAGIDPMAVTHQLAQKGITMYMVGCEPSITPYRDFFLAIAFITGGQYVPLTNSQLLADVIIGGAQEEMSLEQLMGEIETEVRTQVAAGRKVKEDKLTAMMHSKWKSRGQQVQQLQQNNAELATAKESPTAKRVSKCRKLSDVRKKFKPTPVPLTSIFAPMTPSGFVTKKKKGSVFVGPIFGASVLPPKKKGKRLSAFARSASGVSVLLPKRSRVSTGTKATAAFISGMPMAAIMKEVRFDTVTTGISEAQSSRMVQKALARNNLKKK